MSTLKPTLSELFFTRNDISDPRIGEYAQHASVSKLSPTSERSGFAILGYPDDQGISLNRGRLGAAQAPATIRKYFYRMTPSGSRLPVYDFGDLVGENSLEDKHKKAKDYVTTILQSGHFLVSLGGGHDYGFSDGAGFLEVFKNSAIKPLIINFDAHLDCRPIEKQIFHSGTPFRRLIENYGSSFSLVEVGLQRQCNSVEHVKWALENQVQILWQDEIDKMGILPLLKLYLAHKSKVTPVFISIDLDVLESAAAPGVSHGFVSGMKLQDLIAAIEYLDSSFQVKSVGLYEVSPPLDLDDRTSKTAALLIHKIHSEFSILPKESL